MLQASVTFRHFAKKYDKIIFENVNLKIEYGSLNYILSANGMGKTTLFKCLLGLESYGGVIEKTYNNIFCIYDDMPFYKDLSGLNNIKMIALMYDVKKYDIQNDFLNNDILKRKVKDYSYGEKKKLALMLVDIISPDILILDEATNGLDYATIKLVSKCINRWKKDTLLIASGHQLDYYSKIADNIFLIKDRDIIKYQGELKSLEDIYENIYE